jgi:hypothetical protein
VRTHQPGQAAFESILPGQIEWSPFAPFPPAARLAILCAICFQAVDHKSDWKTSGVRVVPGDQLDTNTPQTDGLDRDTGIWKPSTYLWPAPANQRLLS